MFSGKLSFRKSALLIAVGASLGLVPASALADTLHVPKQYPTIQAALSASSNGDIILVAPGVYEGPGNHDLDFAGKAVALRGDGGAANCIIALNATPDSPRRAVHFRSGETYDTVFEGFTVRGGATPAGAVADIFNGAAILLTGDTRPNITNCIFENNRAGCWGGAVTCSQASPIIQGCIFRGNTADDDGGAFFQWGNSHPVLINCLFVGNSAPVSGGAASNFGGSLTMTACTFVGNTSNYGHAVYSYLGSITNSIAWDNDGSPNHPPIEGNTAVAHSNVQGGRAGVGNIDAAPLFADPAAGDYRLLAGSPGIDAGDSLALFGVEIDLDGNARIRDGDADRNAIVDMGAFEFQGLPCPADWNHDDAVTSQDFFDFLAAFFASAADFNQSGATDSQDFFDFLGAFFTDCP
jgi:hypothetical protein